MSGQEKYNSPLATNIRALLDERETNITAIARVLGISRQAFSQYADGTGQPNAEKLTMIADYFDVSVDWLLGRSGGVKTIDADVRSATQYTGLSESAAKILHDLSKKDDPENVLEAYNNDLMEILNGIIESEKLRNFLECIFKYIADSIPAYELNPDKYYLNPRIVSTFLDWAHGNGFELMTMEQAAKVNMYDTYDILKEICTDILESAKRGEKIQWLTSKSAGTSPAS